MMKNILRMTVVIAVLVGNCGWAAEQELGIEGVPTRSSFNLSFKGGKPAQLVEAMATASGTKPNVLIPPELANIEVPAMELRGVETRSVFESLSMLWRGSTTWVRTGGNNQTVWVLSRGGEARHNRVFYIGHLLKKFKVDDITTAIRSTWQLGEREPNAELKYHQDTQLLLAFGSLDQLNTMAEVLAQLKLAVTPEGENGKPTPAQNKAGGKE